MPFQERYFHGIYWQVCGSSEFGTVFVRGVRIRKGKWYYEVKLVTNGIIQMGWADHNFKVIFAYAC